MSAIGNMQAAIMVAGSPPPAQPRTPPTPALVHTRWLLEEYRVSLFAQRLGTAEQVSLQRIAKALQGR